MEPVLCFRIPMRLAEAEVAVRRALQMEGFGILTEVDVAATLKEKLGVERAPYRILGACNPALAHASVAADGRVGAYLPCGVALYEEGPSGDTTVAIQNPEMISRAFDNPLLVDIGDEAFRRLQAALASVERAHPLH
jgi:uncharacterized protein (DUF302 family)